MDAVRLAFAKYRIIAYVILLVLLLSGAAAAGAVINGWRLDADHQRAMATEKSKYDDLYAKVIEQNRAVDALAASSKAADERSKLAETYAAGILQHIGSREQAVANSKAPDCNGVLKEAWGTWR